MSSGDLTPILLSANSTGLPINVTATATPGTLIHTAAGTGGDHDLITLYAHNIHTATVSLVLEWGTATGAQNLIIDLRPNSGPILVADRVPLTGSNVVRAFCATTAVVNIVGRAVSVEAPT